jgi:hypothetical protein
MPRPPESDGNTILAVLALHKVACVLIGNYPGLLRGVDLATDDVDITPATTAENLKRLAAALAELEAAIRLPNEPPLPSPPTLACSPTPRSGTSRPATATSTSPPAPAAPKATRTYTATPTDNPSPPGCTLRSPRSRTSSAARPRQGAPRTSPRSRGCAPRLSAREMADTVRARAGRFRLTAHRATWPTCVRERQPWRSPDAPVLHRHLNDDARAEAGRFCHRCR